MDAQNIDLCKKRKKNALKSKKNKKMKLQPSDEPIFTTNITDLDDDCLEYIFKKLNLSDLLNVADSSKSFKKALNLAYLSKYGKNFIVCIYKMMPSQNQSLQIRGNRIRIGDLSTGLKMLRCFGHLLMKFGVDYKYAKRCHHSEVDRYLNKYCADNLKIIAMDNTQLWTMENIKKPFSKVHLLVFIDCRLGENLTNFKKWFPELKDLTFIKENVVTDRKSIVKRFPQLKHFIIELHQKDEYTFKKSHIKKALCMNPQIQYLEIRGDVLDAKFLHSISDHLQLIRKLCVVWNLDCFNYDGIIHFRNVIQFEFKVDVYENKNTDTIIIPKIPFSFDQLNGFKFHLNKSTRNQRNDNILDFIGNQTSLTKLILISDTNPFKNDIEKSKLTKATRFLKEITAKMGKFTIDEILDFIYKCESVNLFSFDVEDNSEMCDRLGKILGNEWRISNNGVNTVVLHRY